MTVAMASGKPAAPRSRPVAAAAPHAPLVIAQTGQIEPVEAPARDPNSFLAKTIDLKDHVVAATQRVVTAIGTIPSWIGERIGGSTVSSPPPAGSPARPGDALATLWVNGGAINQRQDDTAACGSANRLATSTMRTVCMKPGVGGATPDEAGNAHRGLLQRQICRLHPNT